MSDQLDGAPRWWGEKWDTTGQPLCIAYPVTLGYVPHRSDEVEYRIEQHQHESRPGGAGCLEAM